MKIEKIVMEKNVFRFIVFKFFQVKTLEKLWASEYVKFDKLIHSDSLEKLDSQKKNIFQ